MASADSVCEAVASELEVILTFREPTLWGYISDSQSFMTGVTQLRALPGGLAGRAVARSVPLGANPVRPGEMPARLVMAVALEHVWPGVPVALQAVIAIEAAHAFERVSATGLTCAALDRAAEPTEPVRALIPRPALLGYSEQLLDAGEQPGRFVGELEMLPPSRLLGAWRLAAFDAELELEQWMTVMLDCAPADSLRWEAAAAAQGLTLTEWVALQALSA